jgi:Flp pilus assembly protein TadG
MSAFRSTGSPSVGSIRRVLRRGAGDNRGAAAIEFGIIVPLLAILLISAADVGLGVYRKMQVEDAAQAGAEYAIRHGFNVNAISAAVLAATSASTISSSPAPVQFCGCAAGSGVMPTSCGATCPAGGTAGTYTTVSAQGSYSTILNYTVVPDTYTFSAQSTVRLQ